MASHIFGVRGRLRAGVFAYSLGSLLLAGLGLAFTFIFIGVSPIPPQRLKLTVPRPVVFTVYLDLCSQLCRPPAIIWRRG